MKRSLLVMIGATRSGKTTAILNSAKLDGGIIVFPTLDIGKHFQQSFGLKSEQIASFKQLTNGSLRDVKVPVYIEEVGMFLKQLAPTLSGLTIATDLEDV